MIDYRILNFQNHRRTRSSAPSPTAPFQASNLTYPLLSTPTHLSSSYFHSLPLLLPWNACPRSSPLSVVFIQSYPGVFPRFLCRAPSRFSKISAMPAFSPFPCPVSCLARWVTAVFSLTSPSPAVSWSSPWPFSRFPSVLFRFCACFPAVCSGCRARLGSFERWASFRFFFICASLPPSVSVFPLLPFAPSTWCSTTGGVPDFWWIWESFWAAYTWFSWIFPASPQPWVFYFTHYWRFADQDNPNSCLLLLKQNWTPAPQWSSFATLISPAVPRTIYVFYRNQAQACDGTKTISSNFGNWFDFPTPLYFLFSHTAPSSAVTTTSASAPKLFLQSSPSSRGLSSPLFKSEFSYARERELGLLWTQTSLFGICFSF